jgi:hypothetical protein
MQRRDALRLLASTAALSAMPIEALRAFQLARTQTTGAGLRTLNPQQNVFIESITDLIIPETSTPGAKGVRVNEFIDLMLTEWYDKQDSDRFLQGIADADAVSRKQYGKTFVQCSATQQILLMKGWDEGAMRYSHVVKMARKAKTALPPANFFYTVKRLTLVGYYTSEVGFLKELGATIIPLKHAGCAPLSEARS